MFVVLYKEDHLCSSSTLASLIPLRIVRSLDWGSVIVVSVDIIGSNENLISVSADGLVQTVDAVVKLFCKEP